MVNPAGQ